MENKPTKPQVHAYPLIALLWLLCLLPSNLVAQNNSSSRAANRHFQKAEAAFQQGKTQLAIASAERAITSDNNFTQAWMLLGEIYREQKMNEAALQAYQAALKSDSSFFPVYGIVGGLYIQLHDYEKAKEILALGLRFGNLRPETRQLLINMKALADFRQNLLNNRKNIVIENLGDNINTPDDEFVNSVLLDGSLMLITRKAPVKTMGAAVVFGESFYTSNRAPDGWTKAEPLFLSWEPPGNMGSMSMSPEGRTIYFAGCGWQGGFGSCDIYQSEYQLDGWGIPLNMGAPVNTTAWETQPSISVDGTELYFVSNRSGGYGGADIYRSVLLPNGKWGSPQNLGDLINTQGNEMSPFLHPDGQTLYFASDGHRGMGGYDLFVSRRDEVGRWQAPENLGVPINTSSDDISLITNADGSLAYLSSNRDGGQGGFDVYFLLLPAEHQASAVAWVRIVVKDAKTSAPLAANFSLKGLTNENYLRAGTLVADSKGLLLSLPSGSNYALHIEHEGYLFHSEYFNLELQQEFNPGLIEVFLQPLGDGISIVLKNVFFELNSAALSTASFHELRLINALLVQNPSIHIELGGHTDNTGSEAFNQRLSLERAESVKQWLVKQGVDKQRIKTVGYGASKPVDDNSTVEGRAANRRTELKIVR